jgi:hypothetical protein
VDISLEKSSCNDGKYCNFLIECNNSWDWWEGGWAKRDFKAFGGPKAKNIW